MQKRGFTLIEILVVMGIIGVLATIVLIAVNPARQFAQARDTQRVSNVNAILNAIGQYLADNKGVVTSNCAAGSIPATTTIIRSGTTNSYDIYPCIVPTYISSMPYDPKMGHANSATDYNTFYTIFQDQLTGRITISAPDTEIATPDIAVTR